jgi:hypothetical protein
MNRRRTRRYILFAVKQEAAEAVWYLPGSQKKVHNENKAMPAPFLPKVRSPPAGHGHGR